MKLCVTSSGKNMEAQVYGRFGRAPYFLIVDTDTMDFEAIPNTTQVEEGAGIKTARLVSDNGAEAVLTGHVGPKAFDVLKAENIKIYEGVSENDSVREAVESFNKGDYKESSSPSSGPGRGRGFRGGWE